MKIRNSLSGRLVLGASVLVSGAALQVCAQNLGYQDTPLLPGGRWHVHDGTRPQPTVVTPGSFPTADAPGTPPSDAIVLFSGTDLSKWRDSRGNDSGWKVENGAMVVPPKGTPNGGDIVTRESFGDMQLHVEWASPSPSRGSGQGRGNSGIFLMGRYELQVLDSHQNPTYPDGQAASLYSQTPPLVNAARPSGQWQAYDVIWTAPRFKDGQLSSPARITVLHNGVVVQNNVTLLGASSHRTVPKYSPHEETGPIRLQDHGDPVRFRNIWVRPLPSAETLAAAEVAPAPATQAAAPAN
jgi:hypothetical protein